MTEGRFDHSSPQDCSVVPSGPQSVRDKHVLIIGINYAPEPTGIAPYTTQIAEYFGLSAASVTVLCGPPSYPAWKVEAPFRRWRLFERRGKVNLIRLRHYVPRSQTALRRGAYEISFAARVATQRILHRPDLIFAVTPSLGGAAAAALLARRYSAPLLVHVQDLLGKAAAQSGIEGGGRVASVVGAAEGWTLRRADQIGVVSDSFIKTVTEHGVQPNRITLLRNWTHVAKPKYSRNDMRRELGWPEAVTVALHTGNMGLKQDLGNIVEAARLSHSRTDLLWVLMGDGSQRQALEVQGAGLTNLIFLAPCAEDLYTSILAAADLLLLNERGTVAEMSLPSKLTSYFAAGRPIVAALAAEGASAREVALSEAGVVITAANPSLLVETVSSFQEAPEKANGFAAAARAHASKNTSRHAALAIVDSLAARALAN